MRKYKCLVADDEILERDVLEAYLKQMPQVEVVAVCQDGLEAQQALAAQEVDIVFSDIDMPVLSGMGLLKSLRTSPVFVFISAHPEYAVESYNLDVVDFIVKPLSLERLLRSVNKAIEYLELKQAPPARHETTIAEKDDYIFIRENNDLVRLHLDDVAYIESMGDFSRIYTVNDKKHVTLVSLKNLELQLPAGRFSRVHKQYIVNHQHISSISTDSMVVNNKQELPLSPAMRAALLERVVGNKVMNRHIK